LNFCETFEKSLLNIAIPTTLLNFGEKAPDLSFPISLLFKSKIGISLETFIELVLIL